VGLELRTLITGASGFIGRNFLNDRPKGELHILTRAPILYPIEELHSHIGDINNLGTLHDLANLKFDRVIHLAWEGLPNLSVENNEKNFSATKRFLISMIESGVQEIITIGSCLEYGDLTGCVSEDVSGQNIDHFGRTKLELLDFLKQQGINYYWIRLFYAFGPYQHPKSLLNRGLESRALQQVLELREPNAAKDFIYIKDAIKAIELLIDSSAESGVYNVGSGTLTSPAVMLKYLFDALPNDFELHESNLIGLQADLGKIKNACGWEPEYSSKKGVDDYKKWISQNA
jgi:nucleoside-diphosphate-sugar epimerase